MRTFQFLSRLVTKISFGYCEKLQDGLSRRAEHQLIAKKFGKKISDKNTLQLSLRVRGHRNASASRTVEDIVVFIIIKSVALLKYCKIIYYDSRSILNGSPDGGILVIRGSGGITVYQKYLKSGFISRTVGDGASGVARSWFPASEVHLRSEQIDKKYCFDDFKEHDFSHDVTLKLVCPDKVLADLQNDKCENIVEAESRHSDLVPAKYEGGLKIWECSYDLGKYLLDQKIPLGNKVVLDLGCGAGVVGLIALLKGSSVHFQDYNVEVINSLTVPNVLLNLKERKSIEEKCEFYSGDWESFVALSSKKYSKEDRKYDLILTSETIYNPENHTKLYEVFKQRLKNDGVGYVAGKTYYFGVGGGMRQFENLIKKDGVFDAEIVWKSGEGVQREILMMAKKS